MLANAFNRIACSLVMLAPIALPAQAQSISLRVAPVGPISASAARISAESMLSSQGAVQHYKRTCGKRVLLGLMIGAGAGAAYGTGLSLKYAEARLAIPALALIGGMVGAN